MYQYMRYYYYGCVDDVIYPEGITKQEDVHIKNKMLWGILACTKIRIITDIIPTLNNDMVIKYGSYN